MLKQLDSCQLNHKGKTLKSILDSIGVNQLTRLIGPHSAQGMKIWFLNQIVHMPDNGAVMFVNALSHHDFYEEYDHNKSIRHLLQKP